MANCINTVSDFGNVREAVCVSTRKIMDACRDQDCMEDVAVYLTAGSQETLENATTVKPRCAELLYTDVTVEPLNYRDGYYCIELQYYYRIIADAVLCAVRPAAIYGLATFTKRATLFAGEDQVKRFSSEGVSTSENCPTAVVEALDPTILTARIVDLCHCRKEETRCCCLGEGLPEAVTSAFDDQLVMGGMSRQLVVTLGQFSLIRLERQTQLLIPSYDYCLPEKICCDGEGGCQENPCETFCNTAFPVSSFFPQQESWGGNGGTNGSSGSCCSCRTQPRPEPESQVLPPQPPQEGDCCQEGGGAAQNGNGFTTIGGRNKNR